jgi:hypothetical protein
MKKYLQPDEKKITFCHVDKKGQGFKWLLYQKCQNAYGLVSIFFFFEKAKFVQKKRELPV